MAKMENLGLAEAEIFSFLKRSFRLQPNALKPAFIKLLENLKEVEKTNSHLVPSCTST